MKKNLDGWKIGGIISLFDPKPGKRRLCGAVKLYRR